MVVTAYKSWGETFLIKWREICDIISVFGSWLLCVTCWCYIFGVTFVLSTGVTFLVLTLCFIYCCYLLLLPLLCCLSVSSIRVIFVFHLLLCYLLVLPLLCCRCLSVSSIVVLSLCYHILVL